MGWGIRVKDVEIRGVHKNDIDSSIEEHEETVQWATEKLIALAAASPYSVKDEAGYEYDWIDHVQMEVRRTIELLIESSQKLRILYEAKNFPDDVTNF